MLVGNRVAAIGTSLLQERERVPQTTLRHARNHRHRAGLDLQFFFLRDFLEPLGDFRKCQRAEMKMLRPRTNRVFQIFRLCRGHDEDHAVRRLFQRFQQRVRRFTRQHVRFVEDHDLGAGSRGRITHHLAQLADLVDAAVRGCVDLNDVERSSYGNFLARIAYAARLGRRSLHAVQCFCENSGRRGLSHATRAGKNVRVRHAVVHDGVF